MLLGFVSCRDFHVNLLGDVVIAEVDTKSLMLSELSSNIPKEFKGEDSLAFVEVYIDKWIRKQVKIREAERVFFTSEADIEAMVEEYRQLLLIKKLDERYVNLSIDTIYTDSQIARYYQDNATNFRLNREIVKGEVLRVPLGSDQTKKLDKLFGSDSESKRADMLSICEKNGFVYTDLSASWVDAVEIFDLLPIVRSEQTDKLLTKRGVAHIKDSDYDYYYQIFDNLESGDIAPLEWVRSTIRTILATERQQALIRSNEESLYGSALLDGVVRRQYKEREQQEKKKEKNKK